MKNKPDLDSAYGDEEPDLSLGEQLWLFGLIAASTILSVAMLWWLWRLIARALP